jgi:hypothetical protein
MGMIKEISKYSGMVAAINYDNREGGKYAYVQFLAYSREIMNQLNTYGKNEVAGAINELCLQLNDQLADSFREEQRTLFERCRKKLIQILWAGGQINHSSAA